MVIWPLQEAKAQFSELIRACIQRGPQMISVRGVETAVMLSKQEYESLIGKKPSFLELMEKSPLKGLDLDFERDRSPGRDIDLS